MRVAVAALALLAVVFVVGCQDTKKVTELQGQLDKANQQISDLETQVQTLTATKDSLVKVIADMEAKAAAKGGSKLPAPTKKTGSTTGGGLQAPVKK